MASLQVARVSFMIGMWFGLGSWHGVASFVLTWLRLQVGCSFISVGLLILWLMLLIGGRMVHC